MRKKIFLIGCMITLLCSISYASNDSTVDKIAQFPNRFFNSLNSKAKKLDDQLTRQSIRYLEKMAKKERKMYARLYKTDSNMAKNLFAGSQDKYRQLEEGLKNKTEKANSILQGEYLANIDSTNCVLSFMKQNGDLVSNSSKMAGQVNGASTQFNELTSKFQQADQVKEFIRQRKQLFQDNLAKLEDKFGVNKYLAEYNKQVYYYSEQVREYKEMLNDPDKMLEKALEVLNKIPSFQNFVRANSQLAGMFGFSSGYGSSAGVVGLQTRAQVQQLLQSQIATGGSSGMAAFNSTLSGAHQSLDQFKDKLGKLGGGSGDMDMPDFKPNPEKTHSFLKRIEIGTNLQTTRASFYFPTTTDIGLSVGYKLNSRSTIGFGGSYKIGWGTGFDHIAISSQGVSLRSFLDVKIKGTFYASGGFEYNYQKPFNSLQQIQSLQDWTKSGLIGLTKMVSLPGKFVKKTKVQILWDFLSYRQVPPSQPIIFRVGYNF